MQIIRHVFRRFCFDNDGRIDAVVANAGIFTEGVNYPELTAALDGDMATVRCTLETNTLGHMALYQGVIPAMRTQGYGRIAVLSSVSGRLADMGAGMAGYRMSHVANNALARVFAAECEAYPEAVRLFGAGRIEVTEGKVLIRDE